MSNIVTNFLKDEARGLRLNIFDSIFGEIKLNEDFPIKQSSGAVYGIFVKSQTSINNIALIPNSTDYYPVYWGKDINPTKRIAAHIQNHSNTGNADLGNNPVIANKPLLFGVIFVSEYRRFEEYLHNTYPPLIGSNLPGRSSSTVELLN